MAHDALIMIDYSDKPPLLVFGDTKRAISIGREMAELAEWRVMSAGPVDQAIARIAAAAPAPIFVNLEDDTPDPTLPALLDKVQAGAEMGRSAIVAGPATLIDLVAARAPHPAITHLVGENASERIIALRLARTSPPSRLHDVRREGEGLMQHALLHQLSEEVGRIAGILASMSDDEDGAADESKPASSHQAPEHGIDAAQIRAIIRARRLRDQFFRSELFADPAWDMLLDLMAARIEKTRVAVSSLCIAAAVPTTTALRWIKALTDRGIFIRSADPQDGRRVYIELSDEAARSVAAYLRAAQRLAPTVI